MFERFERGKNLTLVWQRKMWGDGSVVAIGEVLIQPPGEQGGESENDQRNYNAENRVTDWLKRIKVHCSDRVKWAESIPIRLFCPTLPGIPAAFSRNRR